MDNPGEILRLCRLCLVKDQVNIPIFEEQGDIRQIFLKISSCLPVTVSRDDQLPKKICDGCSNKLDLLYEFWNTSANAEKTLLSWLGQAGVKDADETISAVAQQIAKPAETQVKQEDLEDGHAISQDNFGLQSFDEDTKDEAEPPPRKRARRTAAVKAQISIAPESDDDDDDIDNTEAMTKVEGESEESDGEDRDPSYGEVPGTSADDQAGPSGVGKDGVEAPSVTQTDIPNNESPRNLVKKLYCNVCGIAFNDFITLHHHIFNSPDKLHIFKCIRCGYKIGKTLVELIRHVEDFCHPNRVKLMEINAKSDLNHQKYFCEFCNRSFGVLDSLVKHLKVHKGHFIPCSLCSKTFSNIQEIMGHFKEHTVANNINLRCKLCTLQFYSSKIYKLHHYAVHSQLIKIPFECSLCPRVFVNDEEKFEIHIQSHCKTTIDPNRPKGDLTKLTCEVCAEVFNSVSMKKTHRSCMHDESNPYVKCVFCSMELPSISVSDHLKRHQRIKAKLLHSKPTKNARKINRCPRCLKPFLTKFDLKQHTVSVHYPKVTSQKQTFPTAKPKKKKKQQNEVLKNILENEKINYDKRRRSRSPYISFRSSKHDARRLVSPSKRSLSKYYSTHTTTSHEKTVPTQEKTDYQKSSNDRFVRVKDSQRPGNVGNNQFKHKNKDDQILFTDDLPSKSTHERQGKLVQSLGPTYYVDDRDRTINIQEKVCSSSNSRYLPSIPPKELYDDYSSIVKNKSPRRFFDSRLLLSEESEDGGHEKLYDEQYLIPKYLQQKMLSSQYSRSTEVKPPDTHGEFSRYMNTPRLHVSGTANSSSATKTKQTDLYVDYSSRIENVGEENLEYNRYSRSTSQKHPDSYKDSQYEANLIDLTDYRQHNRNDDQYYKSKNTSYGDYLSTYTDNQHKQLDEKYIACKDQTHQKYPSESKEIQRSRYYYNDRQSKLSEIEEKRRYDDKDYDRRSYEQRRTSRH